MSRATIHYIGHITIKSLRDFILDNNMTEHDTLLLNQIDFDELSIEYRNTYKTGLKPPFFLVTVLIQDDTSNQIPIKRIGILKNDNNRFENDFDPKKANQPNENYAFETIYRCGWCGNIVDGNGSEFDSSVRQFKINILQKYGDTVTVQKVNGDCCPNGHNK